MRTSNIGMCRWGRENLPRALQTDKAPLERIAVRVVLHEEIVRTDFHGRTGDNKTPPEMGGVCQNRLNSYMRLKLEKGFCGRELKWDAYSRTHQNSRIH